MRITPSSQGATERRHVTESRNGRHLPARSNAELEVSFPAYMEIREALLAAGRDEALDGDLIDLTGISLVPAATTEQAGEATGRTPAKAG